MTMRRAILEPGWLAPELKAATRKVICDALTPYGCQELVSVTPIPGPGSKIVVFAGPGDFYTGCLTHDNQVVWVMTCGGQEVDSNTDEANALHALTRARYRYPDPKPFKNWPI